MKKILMFLLIATMAFTVCSCGSSEETVADETTEEVAEKATQEVTEEVTEDVSDQFYVSDAEIYEIETPYVPISYPSAWKEVVAVEVTESDDAYRAKFSAVLDEKIVPLYTVAFGTIEEDYMASGTLTMGDKEFVRVYFIDHSAAGEEAGLSAEAETTYLTMCEDINVIISNLIYINGMELD